MIIYVITGNVRHAREWVRRYVDPGVNVVYITDKQDAHKMLGAENPVHAWVGPLPKDVGYIQTVLLSKSGR